MLEIGDLVKECLDIAKKMPAHKNIDTSKYENIYCFNSVEEFVNNVSGFYQDALSHEERHSTLIFRDVILVESKLENGEEMRCIYEGKKSPLYFVFDKDQVDREDVTTFSAIWPDKKYCKQSIEEAKNSEILDEIGGVVSRIELKIDTYNGEMIIQETSP